MNMFIGYVRTDKGREELKKRSKRLNARQRALLLMIEQVGAEKKTVSQPWEHLATPENLNRLFELQLIQATEQYSIQEELSANQSETNHKDMDDSALALAKLKEKLAHTLDSASSMPFSGISTEAPSPSTIKQKATNKQPLHQQEAVRAIEPAIEVLLDDANALTTQSAEMADSVAVIVTESESATEQVSLNELDSPVLEEVLIANSALLTTESAEMADSVAIIVAESESAAEQVTLKALDNPILVEEVLIDDSAEVIAELVVVEDAVAIVVAECEGTAEQASLSEPEVVVLEEAVVADSAEVIADSVAVEDTVAIVVAESEGTAEQASLSEPEDVVLEEAVVDDSVMVIAESVDIEDAVVGVVSDSESAIEQISLNVLDSSVVVADELVGSLVMLEKSQEADAFLVEAEVADDLKDATVANSMSDELSVDEFEQSLLELNKQSHQVKNVRKAFVAKETPNLMDDDEEFLVADEILINGKKPRYDAIPVLTWQVEES